MGGRRAIGLMMLILAVLFAAANLYAFSQDWRQRERLVADGLRQPRGMAWLPDQAIVVAEAGSIGVPNSGRLTWASASSARQTMLDGLPSDDGGGPVGLALGPAGLLVLTGPCAQPRCASLLGPDATGQLAVIADLAGRAPWGLALGPDGDAFVTDPSRDELLRIDRAGTVTVVARFPARTSGAGLVAGTAPRGVVLAPDGTVYVALFGAGEVASVGRDGAVATVAEGLAGPIAVGLDPEGRLLVLEHAAGRLLRDREVVASDLAATSGLLVAPDGRTYVTTASQVVQIRRLGPVAPRRLV